MKKGCKLLKLYDDTDPCKFFKKVIVPRIFINSYSEELNYISRTGPGYERNI